MAIEAQEDELETMEPLNVPYPWAMLPFPYEQLFVETPLKSELNN